MADRRMLTKKVTDDDNFMALSSSAQALYLHLSMSADDDGFCNQVSISMFKAHASVQDLQALLEKRYIYQFDNGVIVIKHWRMANALRKDRYTPTAFQEELAKLQLKDNGSYTWLPDGCQAVAECLPQDRIDKDSIDKDSIKSINTDVFICETQKSSHDVIQKILEAWNSLSDIGITPISKMSNTSQRYKWTVARIKEYGSDKILEAIENVRHSSFLRSGKFNFSYDWFIRPNNFIKVLDGNYLDREYNQKHQNEPEPGFMNEPETFDEPDGEWMN